MLNRKMFL